MLVRFSGILWTSSKGIFGSALKYFWSFYDYKSIQNILFYFIDLLKTCFSYFTIFTGLEHGLSSFCPIVQQVLWLTSYVCFSQIAWIKINTLACSGSSRFAYTQGNFLYPAKNLRICFGKYSNGNIEKKDIDMKD